MSGLPDHVDAWIDRLGNMEFIDDQHDGDTMQPAYFAAACATSDASGRAVEAAVWWM